MPVDMEVPLTTRERFDKLRGKKEEKIEETEEGLIQKEKVETEYILPHPDDPIWYDKNNSKKLKEKMFWAAPYDARFPQQRRQRQCFAYYVDYFRCLDLMGEDYKPCKFFQNVYMDVCPKFWLEKWDDLREEGKFPAKFDR